MCCLCDVQNAATVNQKTVTRHSLESQFSTLLNRLCLCVFSFYFSLI